jgi:hypothetical protein
LTVRSAIGKRARRCAASFAKIGVARKLVNTETSCSVASSLKTLFTTIQNTTVRVRLASLARSVSHTIFTTSARTRSISKTGSIIANSSGLDVALSIGSALTATLGGVSIANWGSLDDVGAESVEGDILSSVRLSSRDFKEARSAGTFPFRNKTINIDVGLSRIGRVSNTRCCSGGTRSSVTDFHIEDVVIENSVETSCGPGSGRDTDGTLGMRGASTVHILTEVRSTETILESNRETRVIRVDQVVVRIVNSVRLIATFARTRVRSGNANLFEERIGRNLFSVGSLDQTETRRLSLGGKSSISVILGRESSTTSVTLFDDVRTGIRGISTLYASTSEISVETNGIAKRVRHIGVAITIVYATAFVGSTSLETLGTSRGGLASVGPLVGSVESARDTSLLGIFGDRVGISEDSLNDRLFDVDSESRYAVRGVFDRDRAVLWCESGLSDSAPDVSTIFMTYDGLYSGLRLLGHSNNERVQASRRVEVHAHGAATSLEARFMKADGLREGTVFVNRG